jgi:di/tricarboxylate transporter
MTWYRYSWYWRSLLAASAAFSTPVSTPVVTLIVDPGRYKFADFVKVGVPLVFLSYIVTLLVAPLIFPFYPA